MYFDMEIINCWQFPFGIIAESSEFWNMMKILIKLLKIGSNNWFLKADDYLTLLDARHNFPRLIPRFIKGKWQKINLQILLIPKNSQRNQISRLGINLSRANTRFSKISSSQNPFLSIFYRVSTYIRLTLLIFSVSLICEVQRDGRGRKTLFSEAERDREQNLIKNIALTFFFNSIIFHIFLLFTIKLRDILKVWVIYVYSIRITS